MSTLNGANGGDHTGVWTLSISDNEPSIDEGYLHEWSISDKELPRCADTVDEYNKWCVQVWRHRRGFGGILDLSTVENTNENGSWTIIQTPLGANPATLVGANFDATGGDEGEYVLQFILNNQPPPGCTDTYLTSVIVENGVDAGIAEQPSAFCFNENELVILSDLITGENVGGTWTETSSTPSQGNAFNASSGTFITDGQLQGSFTKW